MTDIIGRAAGTEYDHHPLLAKVDAPMPRLNPEFGAGPLPDVDQDGLNDDWEFRELLTTRYAGSDDPDGDGQDNASKFAKKTDPLP